jgi:hypothetical protein
VQLHAHAKLTAKTRLLLVHRVQKQCRPVAKAPRAAGVSRQTARKWLNRFKAGLTSLYLTSIRKSIPLTNHDLNRNATHEATPILR